MIKSGLSQFYRKNVVLLQGPIGPFFNRLSSDLEAAGATVFKINFNGGDWFFYPKKAENFRQHPKQWAAFFLEFIEKHHIDVVLLFGDCRPIHQEAHRIALRLNLEIGVFEEGYIRPSYVTFERYGVNANSKISQLLDFNDRFSEKPMDPIISVGRTFWYAAMWGMIYNTVSVIMRPYFKYYQHHRVLSIWQGLFWIRSLWRKWKFGFQQRHVLQQLVTEHDKKFFLVPLQVHNDAQLRHHSDFSTVEAFISEVVNSFAKHAPEEYLLVIKHHPMDRGFQHYGKLINTICNTQQLRHRVLYIHDLHLPTLLNHAVGVVVINSTVGLSALIHKCPVINCGKAIYGIEGLTYQGLLDVFWKEVQSCKINEKLLRSFLTHLINHSQINGSFYRRIKQAKHHSGIFWKDEALNVPNISKLANRLNPE